MALLKPNRIISADFLFWLQKAQKSCSQNKHDSSPCQATKSPSKIRKITLYFAAPFGEIITDMPYLPIFDTLGGN